MRELVAGGGVRPLVEGRKTHRGGAVIAFREGRIELKGERSHGGRKGIGGVS